MNTTLSLGSPSRCRSCGEEIVWTRTTAGKTAPMQRADDGTWVIEDGVSRLATPDDEGMHRYKSHFATCPQASSWRRKK